MKIIIYCLLLTAYCLLPTANIWADKSEVLIAAASDLQFAMQDLIKVFGGIYPDSRIKVSYGSSGNFFSQIKNGAPFDIFFSADMKYPEKLAEEGYGLKGESPVMYAVGRIVIWVSSKSPVDVGKLKFESLLHPSVKKIAIANPEHAPYGMAAKESLLHEGFFEKVKDKFVMGENISQTAQFVQSGAADIGIIALSLAISPKMIENGRYWEIPSEYHNPLKQGFILLKDSEKNTTAKQFADFVKSAEGVSILKKYGFKAANNE
ncbi:MAG: molybdate ABC transporter substrate-binding protein [Nitrospinae bacterium]|nr:molybdate ABC transporter substrate-binding protein [Nitrospinota bacterium]